MAFQRPFLISLRRDDVREPWGFRLDGGGVTNRPVTVQQVLERSLAERSGLHEGDQVIQIGRINVQGKTLSEVQELILTCKNRVEMFVIREDLLRNRKENEPLTVKAVVHSSYNSPQQLYSQDNVADTLATQACILTDPSIELNHLGPKSPPTVIQSNVLKALQEAGETAARLNGEIISAPSLKKKKEPPPVPPKPRPPTTPQPFPGKVASYPGSMEQVQYQNYSTYQQEKRTTQRTSNYEEYEEEETEEEEEEEQPVVVTTQKTFKSQTSFTPQQPDSVRSEQSQQIIRSQQTTTTTQQKEYEKQWELQRQAELARQQQQALEQQQRLAREQQQRFEEQQRKAREQQAREQQARQQQAQQQVREQQAREQQARQQQQAQQQAREQQAREQQAREQQARQQQQAREQQAREQQARQQQAQQQAREQQARQQQLAREQQAREQQQRLSQQQVAQQRQAYEQQQQRLSQQQPRRVQEDYEQEQGQRRQAQQAYETEVQRKLTSTTRMVPPNLGSPATQRRGVCPNWPPKNSSVRELPKTGFSPTFVQERGSKQFVWPPPKPEENDVLAHERMPRGDVGSAWHPQESSTPSRPLVPRSPTPTRRCRGDLVWPPAHTIIVENSNGRPVPRPVCRRGRFDDYIASNSASNVPPTYRVPPGTMHVSTVY